SGANIRAIDNHYHVTETNLMSSSTVPVKVYANGNVVVTENVGTWTAGNIVATGAQSVGRQNISGSTPVPVDVSGKTITVWQRPTSVSFISSPITGWANMAGGTFQGSFVLNECGNVGVATPKPAPKKPTPPPTPKPTKTPTPKPPTPRPPTPKPPTPMPPTPTPSTPVATPVECNDLTAAQVPNNPS